jgi:hypothetical protein
MRSQLGQDAANGFPIFVPGFQQFGEKQCGKGPRCEKKRTLIRAFSLFAHDHVRQANGVSIFVTGITRRNCSAAKR